MYTSFAVVAGDISHETDNIDEQVKTNRLHIKKYSDPKQQYSRKKWALVDEKMLERPNWNPYEMIADFFFVLLF